MPAVCTADPSDPWVSGITTGGGYALMISQPYTQGGPAGWRQPAGNGMHEAPDPACTCGYYAMASADGFGGDSGAALLEVELYGRVIVHERGYRASHQKILRIIVPSCIYCGDEPVYFYLDGNQPLPVCAHCRATLVID